MPPTLMLQIPSGFEPPLSLYILLPCVRTQISTRLVRPFANKMRSFRKVHGITTDTYGGIEAFARQLIATLDVHLLEHEFLLGGAACRGDFALYGPVSPPSSSPKPVAVVCGAAPRRARIRGKALNAT